MGIRTSPDISLQSQILRNPIEIDNVVGSAITKNGINAWSDEQD